MKRFFMFIVLVGSLLSSYAAGFNAKQEALRAAIETSLKSKGYTVEKQDDGLKFISDGDTYYIEIDKEELSPMYVRLVRYVKFDDKIKRENIIKNLTDYNVKYAIKAYCKEKNVILTGEMFVTDGDQFNYVFDDMLQLMKSTYSTIK